MSKNLGLKNFGLNNVSSLLAAVVVTAACGGEDTGSGVGAPLPTTSGTGPVTTTTATVPTTGTEYCTETPPPNANITTFLAGNYVTGTAPGNDTWGDDMSLTGGAFAYQDDKPGSAPVRTQVADGLNIVTNLGESAELASTGYSGFGLWFGPCTDASAFRGITFTTFGTLGSADASTAELDVQLQTAKNYPIEDGKGACMFTSEAVKWDECTNNHIPVEGTNPDMPTVHELTWDMFTGGTPVAMLEPNQLLGVQFQFNCDGYCPVNVTLSNLAFLQ